MAAGGQFRPDRVHQTAGLVSVIICLAVSAIVISHYHYKRSPRKRKAAAFNVPAVVAVKAATANVGETADEAVARQFPEGIAENATVIVIRFAKESHDGGREPE